ncbi:MAG TPA: ABC transporter permease [Opitutaceae bacterium]|nr:ABC transporter permease [Opitutaceae bacterium]
MLSDLKYAFRQLAKSPSHAIIIVLTTALAIAACTVVFSIVNTIVLHPLEGPNADRQILIRPKGYAGVGFFSTDGRHFDEWAAHATSFDAICGFSGSFAMCTTDAGSFRIGMRAVRGDFLGVLGVKPARGRGFLPGEFAEGGNKVVLIKERVWRRALPHVADPVGHILQINEEPYTIIGVLPSLTDADTFTASQIDVWVPLTLQNPQQSRFSVVSEGRLKPAVPMAVAEAELNRLAAAATPGDSRRANFGYTLFNKGAFISAKAGPMLWSLFGAVGCVLLIACANVANLLLARATARQHEIALRTALGAGRGRIMRLFITESLVLALAGGLLGVLLSIGAIDFVRASGISKVQEIGEAGSGLYRLPYVQLDWQVLGFAVVVTLGAGLLFGIAPAFLGSRINLTAAMKESGRGSTEGRGIGRWQSAFVIAEIALAAVLLVGASVFMRSFLAATAVDPGFEPSHAVTFSYMLPPRQYAQTGACVAFGQRLVERLHELPGVQAVATGDTLAISHYPATQPFDIDGDPKPESERANAAVMGASPEYFAAVGVPLLQGRAFAASDVKINALPTAVVVNAALARHHFPNGNAVGRRLALYGRRGSITVEIVGVVGDIRQNGPEKGITDQIYYALDFTGSKQKVIIRGEGDPAALLATVQSQLRKLEPGIVMVDSAPLQAQLDNLLSQRRFTVQLLTIFSVLALVIATVGIYAVVAYNVAQRTSEIGIRMALGAQSRDVLRMILRQGARLAGAGLVLGLGIALAAGRLIEAMLFETSARDPLAFTIVAAVLTTVALLASWIPARRAAHVNPIDALRAE